MYQSFRAVDFTSVNPVAYEGGVPQLGSLALSLLPKAILFSLRLRRRYLEVKRATLLHGGRHFSHCKYPHPPNSELGLALTNGIITLILGILIWIQWPISGLWIIGLFIGIHLIFTGWAQVMVASTG
jgi:hypothetical protein